ncbi:MAG: hypothetical protein PW788_07630 [Micavibrio sp.]|nr:hypothetical protein [Micavibrio sp.]
MADLPITSPADQIQQAARAGHSPVLAVQPKLKTGGKRFYRTADGVRDEDEFSALLIAALTGQGASPLVSAPEHAAMHDSAADAQSDITGGPTTANLVQNGYIANYFR